MCKTVVMSFLTLEFQGIIEQDHMILQDGPGLCFCQEFGVSVWSLEFDQVKPISAG